jgi:hypothetical protein
LVCCAKKNLATPNATSMVLAVKSKLRPSDQIESLFRGQYKINFKKNHNLKTITLSRRMGEKCDTEMTLMEPFLTTISEFITKCNASVVPM